MYTLPYALVYWSEQYIPSGLAAVLFSTLPFYVTILAHFFLPEEESLSFWKVIGIIVGFSGIVFIFFEQIHFSEPQTFWGLVAISASPISSASASVVGRRWAREYSPVTLNILPMTLASVILFGLSLMTERGLKFEWNFVPVASLLYLALFGTCLAFVIYFWLLKRIEASKLSLIAYITPIIALLVGVLFGKETISARLLVGSSLVVLGIILVTKIGKKTNQT